VATRKESRRSIVDGAIGSVDAWELISSSLVDENDRAAVHTVNHAVKVVYLCSKECIDMQCETSNAK
jgi:hypothetical protein